MEGHKGDQNIGTVESLTLHGTQREKIFSLGDAFKYFKNLCSLDLSRNRIICLKGLAYLHSLQFLNLYYNDIASLEEMKHLCHLSKLKSLDLRLNPVTTGETKYRFSIIHTLGTLEILDERTVMENERNAAKLDFRLKEYRRPQICENEPTRVNISKSNSFEERSSPIARQDVDINRSTEQNIETELNFEPRDHLQRSLSPSKTMLQANHPYGQEQKDFEDEYRPLPSPTRSSLRSPDRSGSVRGKEGVRVTFAERSLPDFSPKKDIFAKYSENGSDVKSTSKPLYGNTDKAGTSFVSRDGSQRSSTNTYLTSTPLKTKISTSNQRIKDKNNIIDSIGKHKDLKDFLKPSYKDEEESSSERLLRVSSDLYVSTHMNDAPFSSVPLSNLRKGFGDAYTLPSKPTLGQSHLSTFKMGSQLEFKDHKIAWNPEKLSSFTTESTPILQTEMKRSSSLNCLLSQKPDSAYKGRHTDDLLSNNGLKEKDSTLGSEAASTMDVLQQLMDLVDCYWNGSGSLHQNQRFLVPALQLLSRCLFGDRNKTVTTKTIYGQAEDSVNMELKQKLHKVMEENQVLQSKISKLENKATEMLPASQDELWQKYEKLSLQVESLQQQLKQTHKIQETVNLLHDSQRSLVSTNEYLLQQLNKTSPIHVSKTAPAPTKARSSTDKTIYCEPSDLSFLSSGQYRNPERLSTCPL